MAPNLEFVARINAEPAKREMDSLKKEGSRVAQVMGRGVQQAVSMGMRVTGLDQFTPSAMISSGVNAIRNNGVQDIVNETQQYAGAVASEFLTGDQDEKARAKAQARSELLSMFQYEIGLNNGQISPAQMDFFNQRTSFHETMEKGKESVLTDKRFFGPNITDLASDLFSRIAGSIESGFTSMTRALRGGE